VLIINLVIFVFVTAAAFLGIRWYSQRSKQAAVPKPEAGVGPDALGPVRPLIRQFAAAGHRVPLLGLKERYALQIEQAGLRFELSADEFLGIKAGALVLAIGLALVLYVVVVQNWLIALAIMFLGFVVPDLWLSAAVRKQQHAFLRALPSFLDLLALSVEAGMGFDAAVRRLTEVLESGPLIWRFQTFLRNVNVGKTRIEALREMAQKVNLPDFTTFASVIIQATETGASMGPVLRTASGEMTARRVDRAEKTAHEIPIRILLPLFLFVFPATFMMVLVPLYFQFMASGAAGGL
jgi:tight adherence protein C